jgi:ATP-dependent Clp protease ATP-binding subunit ClpC
VSTEEIQRALEKELVGHPGAVRAMVRSVPIARGGLCDGEAPVGLFLFLGPSGTGKTHTARTLARVLHGTTERLVAIDCVGLEHQQEKQELARQIAPHFRYPVPGYGDQLRAMAPLSILLFEHLEAVRWEFAQSLLSAFESGRISLGDGGYGSFRGCLVLMTSRLCAKEIFGEDRPEIGFSSGQGDLPESEKKRIFDACRESVEAAWGHDFLGHLDDLILFHRLRETHLPLLLERLLDELNRRLEHEHIRVALEPDATRFLVQRGARFLDHGAWYLGKVFRRFVVFPLAELSASGVLRTGARITLRREGDGLACVPLDAAPAVVATDPLATVDVPIVWDETTTAP